MRNMDKITVKDKAFVDLFDDALGLLWIARRARDHGLDTGSLIARQCILTLAMAVEAAANCCLDMLAPRGRTDQDLERLPSLAKFDVYLLARGHHQHLDRGDRQVQPISELKLVRDNLVHPRAFVQEFVQSSDGTYEASIRQYPHLRLSFDYRAWSDEDAENVLRKVVSFLRYYFIEQCKHTQEELKAILYTEYDIDGKKYPGEEWSRQSREVHENLCMNLEFLGFS